MHSSVGETANTVTIALFQLWDRGGFSLSPLFSTPAECGQHNGTMLVPVQESDEVMVTEGLCLCFPSPAALYAMGLA